MKRWKKCCIVAAMSLSAMLLTACGEKKIADNFERTSVILDKSGSVVLHLIEEFDREYYSVDELAAMAKTEAADFNAKSPNAVSLDSAVKHSSDSHVELSYTFKDGASYSDFTGSTFFYGTVAEAMEQKVKIPTGLRNTKNGTVVAEIEIEAATKSMFLATEEKCIVYSTLKPYCFSEGAVVLDDGGIDLGNTVGTAYILFR